MNRLKNHMQAYDAYQSGSCPVCQHPRHEHDGVGCTNPNGPYEGTMCACILAQDMPGDPMSPGVFMATSEGGR